MSTTWTYAVQNTTTTFTVPAGVTLLHLRAEGAKTINGSYQEPGGIVTADYVPIAGEVLNVHNGYDTGGTGYISTSYVSSTTHGTLVSATSGWDDGYDGEFGRGSGSAFVTSVVISPATTPAYCLGAASTSITYDAAGGVTASGVAALSATSTLTIAATVAAIRSGVVALSAPSTLVASGRSQEYAAAALSNASVLTISASGSAIASGIAHLVAPSTLVVGPVVLEYAGTVLVANAVLIVGGSDTVLFAAVLIATSVLHVWEGSMLTVPVYRHPLLVLVPVSSSVAIVVPTSHLELIS